MTREEFIKWIALEIEKDQFHAIRILMFLDTFSKLSKELQDKVIAFADGLSKK